MICTWGLTDSANYERNKVPSLVPDQLKNVEGGRRKKEDVEYDGGS